MLTKRNTLEAGSRFGRLAIIRLDEAIRQDRKLYWLCRCDCGNEATVSGVKLRNGHTRSCGCMRREVLPKLNRTHGGRRSTEYQCWAGMRQRCLNPSNPAYDRYGGRGITICERWQRFENFLADMGARPSPQHSIDRVDNDGPYSPENCRWVIAEDQNRNKRSNITLTFQGQSKLLIDWAKATGISRRILNERVRRGWSVERTLTTPVAASAK